MIDYDAFAQYAPPASSREERDAWFEEKGYLVPASCGRSESLPDFRLALALEGRRAAGDPRPS